MAKIDPNDPIYKNITKRELQGLKFFTLDEKEELSQQLFGEGLFAPPNWEKLSAVRWSALLGEAPSLGVPYRFTHAELMSRCQSATLNRRRRQERGEIIQPRSPTVSSFGDWLMRLYTPVRNDYALWRGLDGERAVVDHRKSLARMKREVPRWEHANWKLVHDGIRGSFDNSFDIPSLKVDGQTLQGVPDLVFREKRTGRILIVEIKISSAALPSDGWPNLRAQLWAYSKTARWCAKAPEVLLAGEVWQHGTAEPVRRTTYFWKASDSTFDTECQDLFQAYGGTVAPGDA